MPNRGYRAWLTELKTEKEPRLRSPSRHEYLWTPKENISDWPEEEQNLLRRSKSLESKTPTEPELNKAFESSSRGFYSRKDLKALVNEGYYTPGSPERIAGEIIPYGKVFEGDVGFRSEKAEISALFEDPDVKCEICRRNKMEVLLELENTTAHVCNECYNRIKKVVPKAKELKERSWWAIQHALASYYDTPLIPLPDEIRQLKGRSY